MKERTDMFRGQVDDRSDVTRGMCVASEQRKENFFCIFPLLDRAVYFLLEEPSSSCRIGECVYLIS